jgi:carbonic anhydrase
MPTLRSVLRHDVPASLVVFLIAIPLSLGIAAASGAPLLAGLLAAVVGGIVAGAIGGAPLQVSGPAAGLTVIVAGTVAEFGWSGTVVIVAMAGVLQIVLGLLRLGRAALALSPAVIHGMLAGIGVVIVIGQVHVVLGGSAHSSPLANLRELPGQLLGHHDGSVLIGALTMAILVLWPRLVKTSLLPAALAAVVVATAVSALAGLDLPRVVLSDAPLARLALPRWPDAPVREVLVAVVTIALVASVESLMSAVAVDKLHDGPRANLNRELVAQGTANVVSGALGGLPVTGVIVRSSANVAAGARTRVSAVLHGGWVALFAVLLTGMLELIPLSALAAVLVVVGVRLVSLAHLRTFVRHRELPAYLVTAGGVVLADLMIAVGLGIGVALVLTLYRLARCDIRGFEREPGRWLVSVTGSLAFVAAARLAAELSTIPPRREVDVELRLDYLDHGAFEAVEDWRKAYERDGGRVRIHEIHHGWLHRAVAGRLGDGRSTTHVPRFLGSWSQWQAAQTAGHTASAMAAGIDEFQRNVAPLVRPHLADLAAKGQQPQQLFITCADSRIVPNMITASGPGDLFCLRNVGNIVPPHDAGDHSVGAAVEYAVDVLGVATITVCGHSGCGAIRALIANSPAADDAALGRWLSHAGAVADGTDCEKQHCLANIRRQLGHLRTYPSVRRALAGDRLRLVGVYFDIAEARVDVLDDDLAYRES